MSEGFFNKAAWLAGTAAWLLVAGALPFTPLLLASSLVVGLLIKSPPFLVLLFVGYAAVHPGAGQFIAPAVVALASWELVRTGKAKTNEFDWLRIAATICVAFVLSLFVADLSHNLNIEGRNVLSGQSNGDRDGRGGSAGSGGNGVVDFENLPDNISTTGIYRVDGTEVTDAQALGDAVNDNDGASNFGTNPPVLPDSSSDSTSRSWWLFLIPILMAAVSGLAGSLAWERSQPDEDKGAAAYVPDSVRRLQELGIAVGRERESHEGVITYARQLAEHTGDERFAELGDLISAAIYGDTESANEQIENVLLDLENSLYQVA